MPTPEEASEILSALDQDGEAVERLFPVVYDQLRAVARRELRRRRPGETLNTTALVHEAYLKLADSPPGGFRDRGHFLAVASLAMRHILVDYARRRLARKRGGDVVAVPFDEVRVGVDAEAAEIFALDEALTSLAGIDRRLGKLVELRFFGGLSVEETAEVLQISERTVKRDWRRARAFLFQVLSQGAAE